MSVHGSGQTGRPFYQRDPGGCDSLPFARPVASSGGADAPGAGHGALPAGLR